NILYGCAVSGGLHGQGTIFKVDSNGSNFMTLYSFGALTPNDPNYSGTNAGGANPQSGLVLSDDILYGTAKNGGSFGVGTIFSLSLIPSLEITSNGNHVLLSWPTWSPYFGLQISTNLGFPIWNNITEGIEITDDKFIFTNTIKGGSAFFRLKQ
ncbi:MAG TPA: choice-of-anchor tandem repeat GloVer-containing protein, partial [Candidatus Binatia bacterium]|nr:choice-of-anchor tandem repeat GloVer-containing protein [Candidatus Binatia bacterium]